MKGCLGDIQGKFRDLVKGKQKVDEGEQWGVTVFFMSLDFVRLWNETFF